MKSLCVDPARINEIWPHVRDLIKRAFIRLPLSSFEAAESDILEGRSLLWLAYEGHTIHAAALTNLYKDYCEIGACGGDNLKEFLPLIKDLERYARNEGVPKMRITGRKGWGRLLKSYKPRAVIFEKAL